jgi:hypothetical protein
MESQFTGQLNKLPQICSLLQYNVWNVSNFPVSLSISFFPYIFPLKKVYHFPVIKRELVIFGSLIIFYDDVKFKRYIVVESEHQVTTC